MPPYLLDANFFIEAYRKSYPMDVFPSFWEKVKALADAGLICSIDKVKTEIYQNEDVLKAWCETNLPEDFFRDSSPAVVDFTYAQVVRWASSKLGAPYSQTALDIFMQADEADAFLIAFARKNQLAIVTNEVSAPESRKNIKIPDACTSLGIRTLQPVQLFRELNASI